MDFSLGIVICCFF